MATKLLPPIIESKLPAQFGDRITIPFLNNSAVGINDYSGMVLKIKTINTNIVVDSIDGSKKGIFNINTDLLKVGQHYKAQIAYKDEDMEGYFSTVGIFKYTAEPTIKLYSNDIELNHSEIISVDSIIKAEYSTPEKDSNEKLYLYYFNLYENGRLLDTTGEQIHNYTNEDLNPKVQYDYYNITHDLNPINQYEIEFIATSMNNLVISSGKYLIVRGSGLENVYNFTLLAETDYESGSVGVSMQMQNKQIVNGKFKLVRIKQGSNIREMIKDFIISREIKNTILLKDYTVQQGESYKYGLYQYDQNGLATETVWSNIVKVDFEDMFLFDGEKQLKIKFNPKISSFKTTILENKLDTIGGKHPFIFRNGRSFYKEFPISGLISYLTDDEEFFISVDNWSTNLTGDNIALERKFKLNVLDWLNNGKLKLFRSPTEGNYIVRLMNVSLSPDDKLGRMLHTFNATAYEVMENNCVNLVENGLIPQEFDAQNQVIVENHTFAGAGDQKILDDCAWVKLYGGVGAKYRLFFEDDSFIDIQIGPIGFYEPVLEEENLLIKVELTAAFGECKMDYAVLAKNILSTNNRYLIYQIKVKQLSGGEVISQLLVGDEMLDTIISLKITNNTNRAETIKIDSDSFIITANSVKNYDVNDFNGNFKPNKIELPNGVIADVVYRIKLLREKESA